MMSENEPLSIQLRDLAVEACVDVFAAYDVELRPSEGRWAEHDERVLCGVLGFLGNGVRGTCILAGTEGPIAASCPRGGRVRDWVGELTNQLGGKLKSQFLARETEVALATPVVLGGIQIRPLSANEDYQPIVLKQWRDGVELAGEMMVWVEAESKDGFRLGPAAPVARHDGQVVLF